MANDAISGMMIDEDQVEVRPEKISASCLDENVCLESCRKYFSEDAWMAVVNLMDTIRKKPVWYCGRCTNPISDESESSVVCDCCLSWYHFKCLNLKQSPKSKLWFCQSCYSH